MRPEPLLHLRAAIKRGSHPDDRDINWLAQNINYLETLEIEIKTIAQSWLDEKKPLLLASATMSSNNHNRSCEEE